VINIREQIEGILTRPGHQLGRGARFVRAQIDLWRFCARRLQEHNLGAMSAALSFRTIFALIPTLVLAFLLIKSIGVVDDGKQALRNFLVTSGFDQVVALEQHEMTELTQIEAAAKAESEATAADSTLDQPPAGEMEIVRKISAADQIESLVEDVEKQLTFERIGPIGALVMIWTAMTLLTTLEGCLNRVFGASKSRSLARRVVLFWSALTLGPILIMAAVFAGNRAIETAQSLPMIGWLPATVGWLTPAVVGILLVAAGYKLIPNTPVRFQAAIGGAMVAVPAWMIARWAFAIYVHEFVLKGNLYGVLGVLPLFLLWLNVSWSIFLFGAELAHTATNLSQLRLGETAARTVLGPSDWLAVAVAIARPYVHGDGPVTLEKLVRATELPSESIQRVIERLTKAELLTMTADDTPGYIMMRPAEKIPLLEIIDLADPRAIATQAEDISGVRAAVTTAQRAARAELAEQSLADLCKRPPAKLESEQVAAVIAAAPAG
jgi:membrane protein